MLLMDKVAAGARRLLSAWDDPPDEADPYYLFADCKLSLSDIELNRRYRNKEVRRLLANLTEAARFRVDRAAVEHLMPLTNSPKRLALAERHLFLPAPNTWIEINDGRLQCGYLLRSEDCSVQNMKCDMFQPAKADSRDGHLYPSDRTIFWGGSASGWITDALSGVGRAYDILAGLRCYQRETLLLTAILALLSTPRLHSTKAVDPTKVNRQRTSRGKWPLLAYQEVTINLLDPRDEIKEVRATGRGASKALHFVRAHLRIRSNGRLEWVSPHWRGDAQLGIRRPAYRLTA